MYMSTYFTRLFSLRNWFDIHMHLYCFSFHSGFGWGVVVVVIQMKIKFNSVVFTTIYVRLQPDRLGVCKYPVFERNHFTLI